MLKRIVFLFLFFISSSLFAQSRVYVGDIESEIDLSLAPYVRRVIKEAEENNAKAVIFKINTFGGRVDAATQIKDAILNSSIPTVAFVDRRAISAGALITLSCNKIIMTPGSSVGASTVVNERGQKQSEKYQSFMRSEMRSTAEKNNRRKDIAEGMVDERIVVPGLVDSTKLITLTADEALKYGIADTVLNNLSDVPKYLKVGNAKVVEIKSNWSEDVVKFLNNPIVSSLLIMIGLVGMFIEIKTPGWGVAGTASIIALALFFGSGYIVELASATEILIFVLGVILLLLEIFVIPGFGIAGVLGIIFIIGGIFLSLLSNLPLFSFASVSGALIQLAISLVFSLLIMYLLAKYLPKTVIWNRMILSSNIASKSGYAEKKGVNTLVGKVGEAYTDLRPAGIALIKGKRIDVVTQGEYIDKGSKIKVIKTEGMNVIVEKT